MFRFSLDIQSDMVLTLVLHVDPVLARYCYKSYRHQLDIQSATWLASVLHIDPVLASQSHLSYRYRPDIQSDIVLTTVLHVDLSKPDNIILVIFCKLTQNRKKLPRPRFDLHETLFQRVQLHNLHNCSLITNPRFFFRYLVTVGW